MIITIHAAAAIIALALGTAIFGRRKGNRYHRHLGRMYAASMFTVSISGFFIYELNGGVSFFHILSVLALWAIGCG
ncbi:MAG: DUF2306 domain-containing protein, partial [Pseudomonadota bacterium]